MRSWLLMMGGLIVWTAHFFALYILASVFGTTTPARIGVAIVTLLCLAGNILLLRLCARPAVMPLVRTVGTLAAGLSLVALVWQALPALLG